MGNLACIGPVRRKSIPVIYRRPRKQSLGQRLGIGYIADGQDRVKVLAHLRPIKGGCGYT